MWTTVKKCKRYLVVLGMTFKLEDGGHGSWAMASAYRVQTFPFGEKMAGLQYSTANEWGGGTTVKIEAFVRRSERLPESGAMGLGEWGLEGDRRVGEGWASASSSPPLSPASRAVPLGYGFESPFSRRSSSTQLSSEMLSQFDIGGDRAHCISTKQDAPLVEYIMKIIFDVKLKELKTHLIDQILENVDMVIWEESAAKHQPSSGQVKTWGTLLGSFTVTGKVKPMFLQFVLEPLCQVCDGGLKGSYGQEVLARKLQHKDPKVVRQAVMSQWLPLADAIFSMLRNHKNEGLELYEDVYSFDDGVDYSRVSFAIANKRGSQSSVSIKSFVIVDAELKPSFDNAADEEEPSTKERKESPSKGQLKWESKKYVKFAEHEVTGDQPSLNASDASPSVASNQEAALLVW
ncbi:hypothetical protein L7F22_015178 [Adiantum nelumboides]|nr:hypothetical protein [Adiantum nelumboides]